MQNGDGNGLGRVSLPFFIAAVIGWTIANGMNIALAGEIYTDENIIGVNFGINIICSIAFGFGGIILALATSLRDEVNKNLSYLAVIVQQVFLQVILLLHFHLTAVILYS